MVELPAAIGPDPCVLVLEEDVALRKLVAMGLASKGIAAHCVGSKTAVVEQYEKHLAAHRPFDLVILDLHVAGKEVAPDVLARLKTIDPAVKAVVSSGDPFDDVMLHPAHYGFNGALAKPFLRDDLLSVIRKVRSAD